MTRRSTDDGWGGIGGYMRAKIQKLDHQFDIDNLNDSQSTGIFSEIGIFVNGHTEPSADKLKALMQKHGGRYVHYYNRNGVTHIVANNLPTGKQRQLRDEKVVSPRWIVESVEAGCLLPWENYQLYPIRERNQKGLDGFLKSKNASMKIEEDVKEDTATEKVMVVDEVIEDDEESKSVADVSDKLPAESSGVLKAGDPGFLSEFYARSRLHHIASWGAEFKDYVTLLRAESNGEFTLRQALRETPSTEEDEEALAELNGGPLVMHVDMDCFFVSVGLRNKPELKGKPVAVAHAKGSADNSKPSTASFSEIASCSYEARQAGVKNGMFLGRARELCPELVTIPYDFEGYKSVSRLLYDTVAKYTVDLEAVSCDELYVDCTSLLRDVQRSPLSFASHLRAEIVRLTSCTASCGFGSNPLLARVATRKAKPNGQHWIRIGSVENVMAEQPVGDLPSVGPSLKRRLVALGCERCKELQQLPLTKLQRLFGMKIGLNLFQLCRGIDNTHVQTSHERKSISAEINYGIRFQSKSEMESFASELAEELSQRMKRVHVKGRTITLKLMLRRADQPQETLKFMGHGICDNVSKSLTLPLATDDGRLIVQESLSLLRSLAPVAENVRGMGIQMHRLDSEDKGKRNMSLFEFAKKASTTDRTSASDLLKNRESTPKADRARTNEGCVTSRLEAETSPIREVVESAAESNAIPIEDLPNYSQVDTSFLAAMPLDIRQELDSAFSLKRREKERAASPIKGRPASPQKGANRSSPTRRGRGRGRGRAVEASGPGPNQLTLTSMFTAGKAKMHPRAIDTEPEVGAAEAAEAAALAERENPEEPSLFGARTAEEIRVILKEWIDAEPEPQSKDVAYFQSFLLACLPRDLELMCQCLSFFATLCVDSLWQSTYEQLETVIQSEMIVTYGGPLKPAVIRRFVELDDL